MARLDSLPAELYTAILEQFNGTVQERQHSIASLICAIPRSPVPDTLLYERIHLSHRRQPFLLYRTLWKRRHDADRIQSFSYECWAADADHVVNLVGLMSNLEEMILWSGPDFAPENLEDMFRRPRTTLKRLSLRFRPYVQKATYYQFLKGAYFDSTLEMLSRWPRANLLSLSIVQDPLDSSIAPTNTFAQPLVFFRLDPIGDFARSSFLSTMSNLRFRIPSRAIARQLATRERVFPSVEHLDLSTTRMSELELEELVAGLARLKSLILDGCPLIAQREETLEAEDFRQWTSLGSLLAAATIRRSKEKEAQYMVRARKRLGPELITAKLATATLTDTTTLPEPLPERILVMPPIPTLRSFAVTAPMVSPDRSDFEVNAAKVREEFERGWGLGIHKIAASRQRIHNSWARRNIAVYEMMPLGQPPTSTNREADIMHELKKINHADTFEFTPPPCPTLCLVGPGRNQSHTTQCPHRISWELWSDDL